MSYTLLSGLSANASWALKPGYTQLDGLSADASWFDGNAAVGINSTVFGSPSYSTNVVVAEVSGFTSTSFGTHSYSTNTVVADVASINQTAFGTPLGQSLLRANRVSSGARFGTPLALFVDRTCVVSGFASNIGTPYGWIFTEPSYGTVTKASSAARSTFGQPSSPAQQTCAASSIAASRFGAHSKGASPLSAFGTHAAFFVYPVAGFALSVFGTHEAASGHEAASINAAQFGSPGVSREQAAAATNRTRFGTPTADMTGTHKTYGFRRSWFGNHRSLRDISKVSGWQSSGFGAAASYEIHRALHIPPEHRFGTHLMKRAA